MTKKHFIALADAVRKHNKLYSPHAKRGIHHVYEFGEFQLKTLADFCQSQNPRFDRQRWLDYIAGKCGPNGGKR
jgi:hypothetical protein